MSKQEAAPPPPAPPRPQTSAAVKPRSRRPGVALHKGESGPIFANAVRVAGMVARTLGPFCEVAVHDFSDMQHSLIHLEGSLTGRRVGAPVASMVAKALRRGGDAVEDAFAFASTTPSGLTLKSSICFLRNGRDEVVGAICLHFDLTDLERFQGVLHGLMRFENAPGRELTELFPACLSDTSDSIIETAIRKAGKHPAAMNREEKKQFVRMMDEEGAFQVKGMVQHLACAMRISIYTVYNYMRQIKEEEQGKGLGGMEE